MSKHKNLIYITLSLIILLGGVYLVTKLVPKFLTSISPNAEVRQRVVAQNFELPDLDEKRAKLSDFLGKRVALIFWTSWNKISLNQLKILENYYKSISSEDLKILAIDLAEDEDVVRLALEKSGIATRALLDNEGVVGELYGIGFLPLTVFIDRAGLEVSRVVGPMTVEEIKAELNRL